MAKPVPALPRTGRPTFGAEPGSGRPTFGAEPGSGTGQSAEFGQFLRVMRARMRPEAAGLPTTTAVRRVPGLRREEIAQLAGVSTDCYKRLEQGRQIRPSQAVVDAVARALQLDATERAHMLDLLHNCPSSSKSPALVQRVRPGLCQLVDAIGDTPALVLGRRTDVLSSNRMADLLFTAFSDLPVRERNLSRWIILEPGARELFRDWKAVAAETVATLRVDVGRHPHPPQDHRTCCRAPVGVLPGVHLAPPGGPRPRRYVPGWYGGNRPGLVCKIGIPM